VNYEDACDFEDVDDQQRTEAWHADRAGCFTASCFGDLRWDREAYKTGDRKGQPKPAPKARTNYIAQVVAEILTGRPKESVHAKALDYGTEMEPEAMAAYESHTGRLVEQVGFMRHPRFNFAGASPDMLIDEDGGGEIKCPMSIVVHAITLRDGLPPEHIEQIQGGLWVTGRKWWDFVSYNPAFPEGLDLYVQRVTRDERVIARIEHDVVTAWDDVQHTLATLEQRRQQWLTA
jgi:hypothetical protein